MTRDDLKVLVDCFSFDIVLPNGKPLRVPITPRLASAKPEQRNNFRVLGDYAGLHWPDVDEDLQIVNGKIFSGLTGFVGDPDNRTDQPGGE